MDNGPGSESFELRDLSLNDIESQAPPIHRVSVLCRVFSSSNPSETRSRAESTRTASSVWPGSTPGALLRWSSWSSRTTQTAASMTQALQPEQAAFLDAVTGPDLRSGNLPLACDWYTSFLKSKIAEAWTPLFRPVLVGICLDCQPCEDCIEIAFKCLKTIVSVFPQKDLALVDIVDKLYNSEVLKEADEDTAHDESNANQLAFAAFGWISLLYTPEAKPKKDLLQIFDPFEEDQTAVQQLARRRSPRHRSRTFHSYQQKAIDSNDQPFYTLLKKFGNIIPEREKDSSWMYEYPSARAGQREGWIDLSLVCFHTLHTVSSVKIEWVDCLSLHLEFESRTKTLKLFRFPSLCFLMCSNRNQSVLSRIFEDSGASHSYDSSKTDADEARQFFKEVLLSYRLIFGQTYNSRKDFNKQLRKWDLKSKGNSDPMLYRLCGHGCESDEARDIYLEIDADDPSNHYNPIVDFPFLGRRLVGIQDYIRGHNPDNIKALWYDRRNVSWWWTFWAVIIIGGLTLFLALVQTILQALQLIQS